MAWTEIAIGVPNNEVYFDRGMHAVAVGGQAYLFGCTSSGGTDNIEARAINPMTCTWKELQSLAVEEARIHFAVAVKEKVYVCVGSKEMKVFDTTTSTWSTVNTSGDVELGRCGVHACVVDGHVYMCEVKPYFGSFLYMLDLSSLKWEIVGKWDDRELLESRLLFPFEKRIYVLDHNTLDGGGRFYYKIRHFDLVTRRWEHVTSCGSPLDQTDMIPFFSGVTLYTLPRYPIKDLYSTHFPRSGQIGPNEIAKKFSFWTNTWTDVGREVDAPPAYLDFVCVVDHTAVCFRLRSNVVYVLDFSPNLRRLCFEAVSRHHLDASRLPQALQKKLERYNRQF